ncbi:phosphoheptose isomerase family protein [Plantactinospora soyae]|uniref:SIS domain-containing protein n=1 Tax=Plantactinospora soyae TaxID=1544732 RepID=A0A927M295_9ACTN|nr:hypothetical protein [Plantactinospora soyae]MBE1485346.1 hypothetical protein [Plantactinospora soyae]
MTGVRRPEPTGAELWAYVRAAARGDRHGPAGTVAALASLAGVPRLGWVHAPPWPVVSRLLGPRSGGAPLRGCHRAVFVGTGGWAFGLRAVCEALPGQSTVRVLDSLDPAATQRVLAEAGRSGDTAGFAVSASGRTRETSLLAATLAVAGQRSGAAPPVWLSERDGALSLTGARDQVALYGTPLSRPALLAARMLCWPRFSDAYREFATATRAIGEWAGEESRRLPATGGPRVVFRLPHGSGPGLRLWTLQAARQGWGGKSERFRPWPDVAAPQFPGPVPGSDPDLEPGSDVVGESPEQSARNGTAAGEVVVDIAEGISGLRPAGSPAGAVATAMATSYAVAALVACVAVRHGLRFATHDAVNRYKRLMPLAPTATDRPGGGRAVGSVDELAGVLAGWLAERPELTAVHVVGYGAGLARAVRAGRLTERLDRRVEVHEGSGWNHHSYQLVWHTRSVGVAVLLAPVQPVVTGDPALDAALTAQRHTLDAIAGATYVSLAPRSLLLRWCPGASGDAGAGAIGSGRTGDAR